MEIVFSVHKYNNSMNQLLYFNGSSILCLNYLVDILSVFYLMIEGFGCYNVSIIVDYLECNF